MSQPWTAECIVSAALATALIEAQFPHLAPARVAPLGVGFDNTVFRVNEEWVFRFPRRQVAVEWNLTEARVTPVIAPRLPLPVTVAVMLGRPSEQFPWPFAGHRMLPGQPACDAALNDAQRHAAAEPLGRFLSALHRFPIAELAPLNLPPDKLGRLNLAKRIPQAREYLQRAEELRLVVDIAPLLAIVGETAARCGAAQRPSCLVHGDFYSKHVLVDDAGEVCGVIDWGDLHLGDPAVDLGIAHALLPPAAHERFRRAYGPIDDQTWCLARFRALQHAAITAVFGHETGDAALLRESLANLLRLI